MLLCAEPGAKPGKQGGHEKGKDFGKEHGGFDKQQPPSKHGENGNGPSFQAGEGDNNNDGKFYSYSTNMLLHKSIA